MLEISIEVKNSGNKIILNAASDSCPRQPPCAFLNRPKRIETENYRWRSCFRSRLCDHITNTINTQRNH